MLGSLRRGDGVGKVGLTNLFLWPQEKRRAERAEQQRIRAEKERERQNRLAVSSHHPPPLPPQTPEQ